MDKRFLIIAGSNRCGTTSLFNYLDSIDDICSSRIKETRFFLDQDYKIEAQSLFDYDGKMDTFLKYFEALDKNIYLEASPDYLYSPGTPNRIKQFFGKNVDILFILRKPSDRFISWFHYDHQLGNDKYFDSFEDYYLKNKNQENQKCFTRLTTGLYQNYIPKYLDVFGKEKVHFVFFENLKTQPEQVMQQLFSSLQLEQFNDTSVNTGKTFNPSYQIKNKAFHHSYVALRKVYQNASKNATIGKVLKPVQQSFTSIYNKLNTEKKTPLIISKTLKDEINDYYRDVPLELEKLGIHSSPW